MIGLSNSTLGILLVLAGVALMGLIWLLLRFLPRKKQLKAKPEASEPVYTSPFLPPEISPNENAAILVEVGGKVLYMNEVAREWFDLEANEQPNLERMARRARPSDSFLGLCAAAGQVRFTLNQALVEGESYFLPIPEKQVVLVSLKRPQLTGLDETQDSISAHAITIFTEISQGMSASLDLMTTMETILESIDRLIPSEFSEINLWNAEGAYFVPYRYLIEEDGIRRLKRAGEVYSLDKGYTGYMASFGKGALLVNNVADFSEARPSISRSQFPLSSYIGIPLRTGGQLIGTIELASQMPENFTEGDKEILELLAGHASVALQNAVIHNKEQERIREMAGLAELAQVSRAIQTSKNLYQQILDTISPLIETEMLGFLIYNEQTRVLEGKVPFKGLPDQFAEMYRATLEEGSKAEAIWMEQDVIIADDMSEDQIMGELGLAPLAQASAMRETVLVPLNTGGRSLGYLQAANKMDGARFSEDDLRLLQIVAGQIAPILENANLIRQSTQRAQRSEALRRVASLAGSEATQDEALKFSLIELNRYFQADVAAIFLLDESLGILQIHEDSAIGFSPDVLSKLSLHLITQANLDNTVTMTSNPLLSNDILIAEDIPRPYRALQPFLSEVHSFMVVPVMARGKTFGELLIGSKHINLYDGNDLQSMRTAADQIATAIERSALLGRTDETVQRKLDELSRLHSILRKIDVSDAVENVLRDLYDEAGRIGMTDDSGLVIFEYDPQGATPVRIMHRFGSTPPSLTMLDHHALNRKETIYIPDLQHSDFGREYPDKNSALVVPVSQYGQIVGLFRFLSVMPEAFDRTTQELLQTLASQTAIVLTNMRQYQDATHQTDLLSGQADALNHLLETRKQIETDTSLEDALSILAGAIQEVNKFEVVVIYSFDSTYEMIRPVSIKGLEAGDEEVFREIYQPWETVSTYFQEVYQISRSYHIPFDQLGPSGHLIPEFVLLNYTVPRDSEDAWIPGDMFVIPVYDARNQPLGLILVDVPLDGLVPQGIGLEMLELFAAEVGLVIERSQKVSRLKEQIEQVETKISKAEAEIQAGASQKDLRVLLKKDLEQTVALQNLYHRAKNIRTGMDISDSVNRQPDRQSVLNSLASQLLTEMGLDLALLAEPTSGGPRLVGQFGPMPSGTNPQALLGQRNPIRHTIQTGAMTYVADLDEDLEWQATPLLKNLNAKGFISLPIVLEGSVEAVILAVSNSPLREITSEDEQVFEMITNQVALTIQNLDLLTETRRRLREVNLLLDFSRQLGSLDPHEILNTLVSSIRRVLSSAHGVRVMLWDEEQQGLCTEAASGYNDNDVLAQIVHNEEDSIIQQAYVSGDTQLVGEIDFAKDYNLTSENLMRYREATGGRLPVSSLLVPMRTADQIQGVVEVDNFNTVSAFSREDQALIESLTQQVALGLENARLFDESRRTNEELERRVADRTQELAREHQFTQILLQISAELSSSLDLDMVLDRSLQMLNDATGAEQCNIYIHRIPEPNLIYRAGAGIHDAPGMGGSPSNLKIKEGLAGWVIENQKPAVIKDLLKDENWRSRHGVNPVYRSTLAAPLIVGQDALGCLMLFHRQPNHFSRSQVDAIQAAANQFAVTINNGELFQLIRDQAEDLGTMLRGQQVETSRTKAMLEGVGDGVLVTDNHNVITLFNDAAERILDLQEESVVGKSLDEFAGLFGGEAESWMETIRAWSISPTIQDVSEMYSERLNLEDGRVISVHLSPVSSGHEFLGTISIFRDITHQVEVDRLKSEFVATVSHELRTPMTPIKGYVEFLLMGGTGDLNEQQREFLQIIKTNVDRLGVLVNDLLDVSRIEAGKVALSFQPIDLQDVVRDAVTAVMHQSEEDQRPVTIDVEMPEDLSNVYGDSERVRQIVTNLIDNAYKYSPEGSRVRVAVEELDEDIKVSIVDQGIGIFPDEQDKIFERFYRGENHLVMATAGTGLGLPIVKELVEMHNGRIWVTSSGVPGEGSTFTFTLPLYQSEREPVIGD